MLLREGLVGLLDRFVSEAAVGEHIGSIFRKLDLPPSDDVNRRILAVLAHLASSGRQTA
ncbi:hypothetical protein [Allosalinactinospora lopnorensis]|uniref:hypothetical protein n=1 Tax=Allosalinactinospora lopnorensis TaxID=1352348 RepID=UPI00373FD92C